MFRKDLTNSFFNEPYTKESIAIRLKQVLNGKVGFYSVGLYPASLAYNCAMQNKGLNLLLAPREGRELFGAFSDIDLSEMDNGIKNKIKSMAISNQDESGRYNTLKDLLINCELVVLSSNSKHIINDVNLAFKLRKELDRENVLIACLVGSFCHEEKLNESFVLCEKLNNLAFFSGFHRHGALRNPLDSFTANFCHPDAMNAILGAKLLYLNFLTDWIVNLFIFLFNTTKEQIDFNFFYMISFLIQFFIIYYFASILAKQIKNSINLKKIKLKLGETYSIINKFAVIQVSIIRSILILSIFIFTLESLPLIEQSSENSIKISQIYNIFSKISDFIIE